MSSGYRGRTAASSGREQSSPSPIPKSANRPVFPEMFSVFPWLLESRMKTSHRRRQQAGHISHASTRALFSAMSFMQNAQIAYVLLPYRPCLEPFSPFSRRSRHSTSRLTSTKKPFGT